MGKSSRKIIILGCFYWRMSRTSLPVSVYVSSGINHPPLYLDVACQTDCNSFLNITVL